MDVREVREAKLDGGKLVLKQLGLCKCSPRDVMPTEGHLEYRYGGEIGRKGRILQYRTPYAHGQYHILRENGKSGVKRKTPSVGAKVAG